MVKKTIKIITILLMLISVIFSNSTISFASSASGGPIVLMGIDAEDGGVNGHGPISVYQNIANSILVKVTNSSDGILVIGANSSSVRSFWDSVGSGTGHHVEYVNGTNISNIDFTGYAMIGVSSDEVNTPGGLTESEHNLLVSRQNDIAKFINNGGGLLGFSSDFVNPYAYLSAIANLSVNTHLSYSDIIPTSEGSAIGVTNSLDVCCWHDEFNAYPGFFKVLATNSSGKPAAIGGLEIDVPSVLEVSPSSLSIAQGQTLPLKVILNNGLTVTDVTNSSNGTTYESNNSHILVDINGNVSLDSNAIIGEKGIITITNGSNTISVDVTVSKPVIELENISADSEILVGPAESYQLNVTATYTDGSTKNVTYSNTGTSYESSNADIFISPNGLITVDSNARAGDTSYITIKNQDKFTTVKLTVKEPPIEIQVNKLVLDLAPSETFQLVVTAKYADGSSKVVTDTAKYMSSDTNLAIINNKGNVSVPNTAKPGMANINISYANLTSTVKVNVGKKLTNLVLTPSNSTLKPGDTLQLKLEGTYSDGTTEDLTNLGTYSISTSTIAVDSNGLVTVPNNALNGSATITGSFSSMNASSTIKVEKPILENITFSPSSVNKKPGDVYKVAVTAHYSDGSTNDVTDQTNFTSSNELLAKVDSLGNVTIPTTASSGTVYIRGTFDGKGGASTVSITAPVLEKIEVSPSTSIMKPKETKQLSVKATYSDGTIRDVTSSSTFKSSNINIATVDSSGLIIISDRPANGTANIQVAFSGKGVASSVTVNVPTLNSISMTPTTAILKPGDTQQINVAALMSDGTTEDITNISSYSSSNMALATVDSNGLVSIPTNATNGTVYIRSSYGGKGASITIKVEKPVLNAILMTPSNSDLKPGDSLQVKVTANMSDGTSMDVTNQASLSSSNSALAIVNTNGSVNIPQTATNGTVYIRASYGGKGASVTIKVTVPILSSISMSPSSISLKPGDTFQADVFAHYSDGNSLNVTSLTDFTTSNSALAAVDSTGLVTIPNNAANGTVYIRSTYGGKGAAITVSVTTPTLTGITMSPTTVDSVPGDIIQAKVIANYSDGSSVDVTNQSAFSSSNSALATVDNNGLATIYSTASNGTVYIRATFNGKGSAITVKITAPTLMSIEMPPNSITLNAGSTYQTSVIANYSDLSTQDVTMFSNFTSSNVSLATVNSSGLVTTAFGVTGTVYIRSNYNGKGTALTLIIQ